MQYRITRHSAAAEIIVLPSKVALIRLKGPLSGETIGHFARECCSVAGVSAKSFVLDYRKAAVAAAADELGNMVLSSALNSPTRLPGAFLVAPRSVSVLREHALAMAAKGVVRRVFTHEGRALAWAGDQAGWQRCFEF